MTSIQQVQQVAKKLETMLETALTQLKSEQKKRKENENRLMELELDLVNKEHEVKTLDNKLEEITREKDEKISNLESSINYLQSVIIEKEQEILRLQEMLEEQGENASIGLSENVEKFENTLNKLLESSNGHNNDEPEEILDNSTIISDDIHEEEMTLNEEENHIDILEDNNEEGEAEEYILDESMEELQNEEDNIAEITEEDHVEIRDIKDIKPKPVYSDPSGKTCPQCGMSFATKTKLKIHQKEANHLPKFECELCGKQFKTKGTKVAHKARIHSDLMPFKCGKCDKRFKDQGSCRRHEANDSVHIRNENIKHNPNLLCNICGKEFERHRRWCLDQHYLVHLSSKKFSCDSCKNSYRSLILLNTHKQVSHGIEI